MAPKPLPIFGEQLTREFWDRSKNPRHYELIGGTLAITSTLGQGFTATVDFPLAL